MVILFFYLNYLCTGFKIFVSLTTVRKTLKILSEENYFIKLSDKITFVSDKSNEIKIQNQKFSSLTDSTARTGKKFLIV